MSTKYPLDYDDAVTLGPTFIDVAPPTDPQRNVAAEFRNNLNDAMEAVQLRLGKLDDTTTSSVDWGLLTVSSVPNQGLRFAGTHAAWPGVIAETGLFVDTATGNVSYHKSGDPLGTFTDLTAGGGASSWDAIYASYKTLNINAAPLTWTQSTITGYGFVVDKTLLGGDSAVFKAEAAHPSYGAAVPVLEIARANPGTALSLNGDISFTTRAASIASEKALDIKTTSNYEYLTLETTGNPGKLYIKTSAYAGSDLDITSGSLLTLNSGTGAGISATAGSLISLTASSGNFTATSTGGVASLKGTHGVNLEVTSGGGANDMSFKVFNDGSGAQEIQFDAHGSGWIYLNSFTDPTLDTTATSIVGAINEINAAVGGVPSWDAIYAAYKTLTIGSTVLSFTQNTSTGTGFQVNRNQATSDAATMVVQNSNAADAQAALALSSSGGLALTVAGTITQSTANPTSSLDANTVTITSGGLPQFSGMSGFTANITGAADHADTFLYGFRALFTDAGSSSTDKVGFFADENWQWGFSSLSGASIASLPTFGKETLTVHQTDLDQNGIAVTSSGANTGDALYIDSNWKYGLYSLSDIMVTGGVLFIGETTTPTPVANYGAFYTKSDNIPYFQDGAGTEHAITVGVDYASMYLDSNSTETQVTTLGVPVGIRIFSAGTLNGWTFNAGSTAAITAYADYSGTVAGTVLATSTHLLTTGDYITIRSTTNYDGLYQITTVDASHFYFTAAWAGDDGASYFDQASYLQAGADSAGTYRVEYSVTIYQFDEIATSTVFSLYKNTTGLDESISVVRLDSTVNFTYALAVGGAIVPSVVSGDRIYLTLYNLDTTDDVRCDYGSVCVSRV